MNNEQLSPRAAAQESARLLQEENAAIEAHDLALEVEKMNIPAPAHAEAEEDGAGPNTKLVDAVYRLSEQAITEVYDARVKSNEFAQQNMKPLVEAALSEAQQAGKEINYNQNEQ